MEDVLPGGKRIKTNQNTYRSFADLEKAIHIATKLRKSFSILPDHAGYWAKSPFINPLPIDWPQGIELNNQQLIDRVVNELESKRESNIVIVQRYEAESLANGKTPLTDQNDVVDYVQNHFSKIIETEYFILYQ